MGAWKKWKGGVCPIGPTDLRVDIQLKNGDVYTRTPAEDWNWEHDNSVHPDERIVNYRLSEGEVM